MTEGVGTVLASVVTGAFLVFSEWRSRKRLKRIKEIEQMEERMAISRGVFESLSDFSIFQSLKIAVDDLFQETQADRFLLLVAVNKKTNFNDITVVYEQHHQGENLHIPNAVARYNHISVDDHYREMLKRAETFGPVMIETKSMTDCLLKTFYEIEGVQHSRITFLTRETIDDHNDAVIFSSMATSEDRPFTNKELVAMRLGYESTIIPQIKALFNNAAL